MIMDGHMHIGPPAVHHHAMAAQPCHGDVDRRHVFQDRRGGLLARVDARVARIEVHSESGVGPAESDLAVLALGGEVP